MMSSLFTRTSATENGDMVSSPSCIAGLLSNYFSSVFTKENTDFFPTARSSLVNNNTEVLTDISFTEEAVRNKLNSLKEDKSGGPDDLPPRLLKIIKDEIYVPLTAIFHCSLNKGIVPVDWHIANVSPLYKKGKRSFAENYRPVSLTS